MTHPLMVCGHAANAVDGNGDPSCAICLTTKIDDSPSLVGRSAKCSDTCRIRPSDRGLAFFEYRGEGSPHATGTCKHCHYNIVAHDPTVEHMARIERNGKTRYENFMHEKGQHEFEPVGPADYDRYYCGCRGWD
jgi:hypothetical protein